MRRILWNEPGHQKNKKEEENLALERKCQLQRVVRLSQEEEKKVVKTSLPS